jgi:ribosome-binding factor A
MSGHRTDKVGAQVRAEIMEIIQRDLKDPRIGFVSITTVRMSPDLRSARVRVSVLGDSSQQKDSLSGLRSATGVIRRELGRRLQNLKFSPELRFEIDPSIEYSVHISKRLREILPEPAELAESHPTEHHPIKEASSPPTGPGGPPPPRGGRRKEEPE